MRAFVVASIMLASCTTIVGIGDYVIGDCKGGNCDGDAEAGPAPIEAGPAPADDSGVPCQGRAGPVALRIGSPGNTFCIDSTEVTLGQYKAFLDAGVVASSQPSVCVWNTTYEPDPVGGPEDVPVRGVDWCDALAYCTWAGKYLCGVVENGRKVGPVTLATTSDFRSHQWLLACSAEARQRYPYGGLFDPSKCNLADYDARAPVPATSTCIGGFDGLHDMIGNVWEWYDGPCRADGSLEVDGGDGGPASDNCFLKGGSYLDRGAAFDCRLDINNIRRDHRGVNVGFRCCSD